MSHANRNFVIAYIFLVGLPVLGLVGVLKSGHGLTAPYSIDGSWKIEPRSSPASYASSCPKFFSSIFSAPFSISQSGKTVVISLNDGRTSTGTLEGKALEAQFPRTDNSGAECGDRSLSLTATLDPRTEPRTLTGTLSVENCAGCSLEFRAVRQPPSVGGGTH